CWSGSWPWWGRRAAGRTVTAVGSRSGPRVPVARTARPHRRRPVRRPRPTPPPRRVPRARRTRTRAARPPPGPPHGRAAGPPGTVHPPPVEQDATAWVAAEGAVSSGEQLVRLSVQGTGPETVVVEGIAVRVEGKRTPLAWNDYAMGYPGVGCGGNVPARSF